MKWIRRRTPVDMVVDKTALPDEGIGEEITKIIQNSKCEFVIFNVNDGRTAISSRKDTQGLDPTHLLSVLNITPKTIRVFGHDYRLIRAIDVTDLSYFTQRAQILSMCCGLHERLGQESKINKLNEDVLVVVAEQLKTLNPVYPRMLGYISQNGFVLVGRTLSCVCVALSTNGRSVPPGMHAQELVNVMRVLLEAEF